MLSVGEKLRRARLEKGLAIGELAERTKVGAKFLEAIEADRRDKLPAGFFFKNWTLQYARALGLDEREIARQIDRILESEAPLPLPGQDQPRSKGGGRLYPNFRGRNGTPPLLVSFGLLCGVVLACSGLYVWWRTHTPGHPAAIASLNRPASLEQAFPATNQTERTEPARAEPVPSVALTPDALQVEILAKEETWLSISPDGKQVFSGVLEPNESKTVGAKESARLKIGNAGGLEVKLNGKPVGEIGPKGQVRILLIGPDGIHILGSKSASKSSNEPEPVAGESDRSAALPLPLEQ